MNRQKSNPNNIEDVYDGSLHSYKEQFNDSGYFHGTPNARKCNEVHLSDGVSVFNSSTYRIWPVYGIINELPPKLRYERVEMKFIIYYVTKHDNLFYFVP